MTAPILATKYREEPVIPTIPFGAISDNSAPVTVDAIPWPKNAMDIKAITILGKLVKFPPMTAQDNNKPAIIGNFRAIPIRSSEW